jgi:hypothetical protein
VVVLLVVALIYLLEVTVAQQKAALADEHMVILVVVQGVPIVAFKAEVQAIRNATAKRVTALIGNI